MVGMARYPDKYFELAIVDPPYGIGEDGKKSQSRMVSSEKWKRLGKISKHEIKQWDSTCPNESYFKEMFRVSKNQITWGANHYISKIPFDSSCWIVWDKKNGDSDFSDCELAWTSFKTAVRKFEWLWNGFQQQKKETRIHPTQKPVALYKWLLKNYAKQGDKILDTHVGSASSLIACHDMGFDAVGFELDKDYYEQSKARLEYFMKQPKLEEMVVEQREQVNLF